LFATLQDKEITESEMQIFQTPSVLNDQMRALPFEFCNTLVTQKTRIDGSNRKWKGLILHAAISIQYQHVTYWDRQTDGQTDGDKCCCNTASKLYWNA